MKVHEYFAEYPESKAVHQTSDGFLFHQEGDAKHHAKSLDDKDVTTTTKAQFKAAQLLEEKGKKEVTVSVGKEKAGKDIAETTSQVLDKIKENLASGAKEPAVQKETPAEKGKEPEKKANNKNAAKATTEAGK